MLGFAPGASTFAIGIPVTPLPPTAIGTPTGAAAPTGGIQIPAGVQATADQMARAQATYQQGKSFLDKIGGLVSSLFGESAHEKEHTARVNELYERALQGDASAYGDLSTIVNAKWPGDASKWLRPQDERDKASKALRALATNTQYVSEVASNPIYAEIKRASQAIRDDLANAVARVGAGVTQQAVDAIGGPDGARTGGLTVPLTPVQIMMFAAAAGILLLVVVKHKRSA